MKREKLERVHVDYQSSKYISKKRWISYWHQINETALTGKDSTVLEIGPGNNIVKNVLIGMDHRVKTADFDAKTHPDYLTDVRSLSSVVKEQFDVVLCCQILEHIPFEHVQTVLHDLLTVSHKHLIVTLPYTTLGTFSPYFVIKLLPFLKPFSWLHIFQLFSKNHEITSIDGHQWEIGKKGYPLKKIKECFKQAGWMVEKEYPIFENPYHYMFVCRKKFLS